MSVKKWLPLVFVGFVSTLLFTLQREPLVRNDEDATSESGRTFRRPSPNHRREFIIPLNNYLDQNEYQPPRRTPPKLWVSMGLCYSDTTRYFDKARYPYAEVTPLAVLLWNFFSNANVLVRIIYREKEIIRPMRMYAKTLEAAGAVVEWVPTGGMDCVLKSQLVRMLAFTSSELVRPEDLVMSVDVNTFIMNDRVLGVLEDNSDVTAWVFQYEESAHVATGEGSTFGQSLITLRAKDWRRMLEYEGNDIQESMESWLERMIDKVGLDRDFTWYYDQWITTHSLLEHRICTVPPYSGLWKKKGLMYDPSLNDTATCWHGHGYKDCNRDIRIVFEGCKWYHFFPDQTLEEHVDKFREITNGTIELRFQKSPFEPV